MCDIIRFSKDVEDHIHHANGILTTLERAEVTLSLKKCPSFRDSVDCPGHIIKTWRQEINQSNTKSLMDAKPSTNWSCLRSFLCWCKVCSPFIPNLRYRIPSQKTSKKRSILNILTNRITAQRVPNIYRKDLFSTRFALSRPTYRSKSIRTLPNM